MRDKRGEKSGDGATEKEETLGQKLRRGVLVVGKRVGPFAWTPVKLWDAIIDKEVEVEEEEEDEHQKEPTFLSSSHRKATTTIVSSRKLAAALWEFQHYLPLSKMHRGVHNNISNGGTDSRLRRHQNRRHVFKDRGFDVSHFLPDPSPSSPDQGFFVLYLLTKLLLDLVLLDQPESAGSLRRHIAASLIQHHRSIERSNRALQPVSPASYGSSMEVAPYNPAVTPGSSLDFKGRTGEPHYSLKTSAELLKVLNRIWSLEEQHASNVSLIKALKTELDHARIRIKELLRDQQADRHEIDDLMKQIAEDKLVRKSKEQDRLHATIQSLRNELEDERKLRKRSESLHRKLARDISEVKSSLSNALKEMERERKLRKTLEKLCDEFAQGIKDYDREVHSMKQKSDKDWVGRADDDCLILHISESWLDERMQMRLEAQHGFDDSISIVDKLAFEIETFLKAKRLGNSKGTYNKVPRERRTSMESVPLNEAVSAPQNLGDEEDSGSSDSHCFELNKPSNDDSHLHANRAEGDQVDETAKSNQTTKKHAPRERIRGRNPSGLQVQFEEQMAWAMACNEDDKSRVVDTEKLKDSEGKPTEMNVSQKSEKREQTEANSFEKKNEIEEIHGLNSNQMIDQLIRSHISLSEAGNVHRGDDAGEASTSYLARRNASPVRQWMSKLTSPDIDISESSTKLPPNLKENTLKAKLVEARSKGHRSRLKNFKSSS